MCTAITFETKDFYFGRNLDLETSYNESVTVTPRNFPITLRENPTLSSHYAMIGVATVVDGYPLYYDGVNEKGLCVAALNFPQNAVYNSCREGKINLSPFEFIPYLLGLCESVSAACRLIERLNLADIPFSDDLPLTPLHWIVADRSGAVTVESVTDGLRVYRNPVGVLTNNPPFPYHMENLNNYLNLTSEIPENRFAPAVGLKPYSRGMGGIGLPGDLSSSSRFVRAAFTKLNSLCGEGEGESVSQFFHILGSVEHTRGTVRLEEGKSQVTVYSSCCNTDRGIYYYKTYADSAVRGIDMHRCDIDSASLYIYPLESQDSPLILN